MTSLDYVTLRDRLHAGKNPVEIAGYGRESTHKGYLTWILDTGRWPQAREGLERLLHRAWERERATRSLPRNSSRGVWWQAPDPPRLPPSFWTEFERRLGKSKVDLMVMSHHGGTKEALVAVELKTDSPPANQQFVKMSKHLGKKPGIVLELGSMAVRDDDVNRGGYADFGVVRPRDILEAWGTLDKPEPVAHWLEALEHEVWRLDNAFNLTADEQKNWWACGYRSPKHVHYARLQRVRDALHRRYPDLGTWKLYDGGYNTVLNLRRGAHSWRPMIYNPGLTAFWEFNDNRLMLKVRREKGARDVKAWILRWQETAKRHRCPWPMETPKALKAKATWISVMAWKVPADAPETMAGAAAEVIRRFGALLDEGE